ncbi:MAG: Gfo/Idh/MocA family oxidoreductase [Bryobacteraceae bacterium]
MGHPLRIAIAGLGRMGAVHARNLLQLQRTEGVCEIAALVETDESRARRFLDESGYDAPVFSSVAALASARVCKAALIATPTENHREHASTLIDAGYRVLLEKPLTGTLAGDEAFAAELDRDHPQALMLGFQRRFDEPLRYAREAMASGAIGRVFKIFSALEDSGAPPDGYQSGGILPDMSVHNVDEVLWLTGEMPHSAVAVGSRLYGHTVSTCEEDFDDAMLVMWFRDAMAQIQVSRNHVPGYRVETVIHGEQGHIHIGRFDQKPCDITVEVYGRRGRKEPIDFRVFSMGQPDPNAPEFMDRFGPAYKAEAAAFIEGCRSGGAFPVTHNDGLRAQRVIEAGMRRVITAENNGNPVS